MSRYIKADGIELPLFESPTDETWVKVALNSAPSIELTPCEKCIFGDPSDNREDGKIWCTALEQFMRFCSEGKTEW